MPTKCRSRIPIRDEKVEERSVSAPSQLQRLQQDYQRKMLYDKQKKLISYVFQLEKQILRRTNSCKTVREYFKERRAKQDSNYRLEKMEAITNGKSPHYMKQGCGRDRSKPLAPLHLQPSVTEHVDIVMENLPTAKKIHPHPVTWSNMQPLASITTKNNNQITAIDNTAHVTKGIHQTVPSNENQLKCTQTLRPLSEKSSDDAEYILDKHPACRIPKSYKNTNQFTGIDNTQHTLTEIHPATPSNENQKTATPLSGTDNDSSTTTATPTVSSNPQSPTVSCIPQSPGVSHIPKSPAVSRIPQSPAVSRIPQSHAVSGILHSPALRRISQSPAVNCIPQPPAVSRIPHSPALSHIPQSPTVSRIPQSHDVSCFPQSPAVSHIPQFSKKLSSYRKWQREQNLARDQKL